MGKYDDMLNMKHHISSTHKHMAMENRAAQFAPFAALSGYDAGIKEKGRLTGKRMELDESIKEMINNKLLMLQDCVDKSYAVSVTYFVPDKNKAGGKYETVVSSLKKIDAVERRLIMTDGTIIPISEIIDVTGEIFGDTDMTDY